LGYNAHYTMLGKRDREENMKCTGLIQNLKNEREPSVSQNTLG